MSPIRQHDDRTPCPFCGEYGRNPDWLQLLGGFGVGMTVTTGVLFLWTLLSG